MQQYLKKALFASLIILSSVSTFGQYNRKNPILEGISIQPKVGFNMFYGDLVSEKRTNYTLGVSAEKSLKQYLSARVDLNFGQMKGTQDYGNEDIAYAYFKNIYADFNIGCSFTPLDLAYGYFKERQFSPYIIGQVGLMYYSSKEFWGEASPEIPNTLWRNPSGITPTVSVGGGVSYYLNSILRINAEFIGTYIFSDKVDGHDIWYEGGSTGIPHQTDGNDFFYTGTIGVTYTINDINWKNNPKYNRKAYLQKRSKYPMGGTYKKKGHKTKGRKRSKSKRYRR